MKKILRNQKGITLVSLAVAIVILVIITNILVYNAKDNAYIKKLKGMNNDVDNLTDKVSGYYSQYGELPIIKNLKYDISDKSISTEASSNYIPGDADKAGSEEKESEYDYYVIDLNLLSGLTLNYGAEFEQIKKTNTTEDEFKINNEFEDLYIINNSSHNIFYVKGVEVDGKKYYTSKKKDDVKINSKLKYIDGVKIPNGCEYISGHKNTKDLIIKDTTTEKKYQWIELKEEITSIPADVKVKDEYEFLASSNANNGYYYKYNIESVEVNEINVIYLPLDYGENYWSGVAQNGYYYKDKNGDKAYIPEGFSVSMTPNMNTIYKGLVVKDTQNNEYVWINVPKDMLEDAETEEEIENTLKEYAKDYRKEGYEDVWYDGSGKTEEEGGNQNDTNGCGLTLTEYNTLKSKMLTSIKEHGGFYIGRYEVGYEVGIEDEYRNAAGNITQKPVIKEGAYPYNFLYSNQPQQIANNLKENVSINGTINVSALFGIQWDLACKFIEVTGDKTKEKLLQNSTSWGNYYNQEFYITKGSYRESEKIDSNFHQVNVKFTKAKEKYYLLTAGASERNKSLNIYDLAGNDWEITLEHSKEKMGTERGGNAYSNASDMGPVVSRNGRGTTVTGSGIGTRLTVY